MSNRVDVCVIGTGPAGMTAARTVKTRRPDLAVMAIRREPSYVPCALPYALSGTIEVDSYVKNETKLMGDLGIDVLSGKVNRLDPESRKVILDDGHEIHYGKLIAAVGATPLKPPIPGLDARNVFTLRTPADIHAILTYRRPDMRITVIGAGYIGLEVACAMRESGFDVTIVELLDRLLPKTADAASAEAVRQRLDTHGVKTVLGSGVAQGIPAEDGTVHRLLLDNGQTLDTDLVVLSLGVRPRLKLFTDAGIASEKDGVLVDDHMRTSAPDVFACGDCTHFTSLITGKSMPGKLATNGIFQGKTAALNAIGIERIFEGFVNTCVTDIFGLRLGSTGLRKEDAAEAGLKVISGTGVSRTAYPMFDSSDDVSVTLIADATTRVFVGGQAMGTQAISERLDLIALAIQKHLTVNDLIGLNHCAHPVQSGVPAHNPIVMAAEAIARKL